MNNALHLNPLARDVIEAIDHNDPVGVKEVLSQNPPIADPNWLNEPILLVHVSAAVYEGKIPAGTNEYAITKALLEAGADVDFFDGYPLAAAVSYNAPHVVRALLESGASVNGTDNDGVPMAYSLFFGSTTVSELLV